MTDLQKYPLARLPPLRWIRVPGGGLHLSNLPEHIIHDGVLARDFLPDLAASPSDPLGRSESVESSTPRGGDAARADEGA